MHPALQGALIGLGIGIFLFIFEYMAHSKGVNERAKRFHKAPEFDITEKRRLATVRNFVPILAIGFAVAFWIIWG